MTKPTLWRATLALFVMIAWPVVFTLIYDSWVVMPRHYTDQARYVEIWTYQADEISNIKRATGEGFAKVSAVLESLAKGFIVIAGSISEIDTRIKKLEKNKCFMVGERWDR